MAAAAANFVREEASAKLKVPLSPLLDIDMPTLDVGVNTSYS